MNDAVVSAESFWHGSEKGSVKEHVHREIVPSPVVNQFRLLAPDVARESDLGRRDDGLFQVLQVVELRHGDYRPRRLEQNVSRQKSLDLSQAPQRLFDIAVGRTQRGIGKVGLRVGVRDEFVDEPGHAFDALVVHFFE